MTKLKQVLEDPSHLIRTKPRNNKFDNNYLYYLYVKGSLSGDYDEARIYLYTHIGQIVSTARPKRLEIPYEIHDDLELDMYARVDKLYISVFEDDKELTIKSIEGVESKGTRFEKYYYPHQVYGYIKCTIRNKIKDFVRNYHDGHTIECSLRLADKPIDEPEQRNTEMGFNIVIERLLGLIVGLNEIDKAIFISIGLKSLSFKELSQQLLEKSGIKMSPYKIKESYNKTLSLLREKVKDLDHNEFIF